MSQHYATTLDFVSGVYKYLKRVSKSFISHVRLEDLHFRTSLKRERKKFFLEVKLHNDPCFTSVSVGWWFWLVGL